jgi:sugar lactone lactonase YvrE
MLPLVQAPDLRGATGWRNVAHAVDLHHDLAGQAVVLVFFTPTCVHSRDALAASVLLDARFAGRPVAVLGVATPRAPADARLDEVLAEFEVRFPVALDADRAVWRAYQCSAWPTLVLLDAEHRVRFHGCGEPDVRAVAGAVRTLLAELGTWSVAVAVPTAPRQPPPPRSRALHQPAGLAFDARRGELWIADTGHHRLLAVDAESGAVRTVVGGMAGASDGRAAEATFCAPRGLWLDAAAHRVLVADTGNHLVRAVETDSGEVTTLLGTGARAFDQVGGARGIGQGLAAPWSLAGRNGEVVVAMAGTHQLWVLRAEGIAVAAVGSGVRGAADGPAGAARLAEPRGLAVRGDLVAWSDAGSDAVRLWDCAAGSTRTLVPGGGGAAAPLQQPAALAWVGDTLLVADTGNGRLVRIDLETGAVLYVPLRARLERPAALALAADRWFVADSARDAVLVVDADTGEARELGIVLPDPEVAPARLHLRAAAECVVKIPLPVPAGAAVHPDVPVAVALRSLAGAPLAVPLAYEAQVEGAFAVVRGVKTGAAGVGRMRAEVRYFTRHGEGRVAHVHDLVREAEVELDADAPAMALWSAG